MNGHINHSQFSTFHFHFDLSFSGGYPLNLPWLYLSRLHFSLFGLSGSLLKSQSVLALLKRCPLIDLGTRKHFTF